MPRIYLSPPEVGDLERDFVLEALESGWIAPLGPQVDAFEAELAETSAVRHAVALNSGTAALHLGLLSAGVSAGDQVIAPTLTFVATANAIRYCDAEPIFVDSEVSTGNMDPSLLADEMAERARKNELPAAIVSVDLFGQCANYDAISRICHQYDVPLIQDAAEAQGSLYEGQPAGSQGLVGVLSFNGNKILTTSGGGALLTDSEEIASRVRFLATQARESADHYEHRELGFNYRLSNLLAALGRAQLRDLSRRVQRRRAIRERYLDAVSAMPGLSMLPEVPTGRMNAWLSVMLIDIDEAGYSPEALIGAMAAQDIEVRRVWKPMHMQPLYRGAQVVGGGKRSEELFRKGVCLPSGSGLTPSQQSRVLDVLRALADDPRAHVNSAQ